MAKWIVISVSVLLQQWMAANCASLHCSWLRTEDMIGTDARWNVDRLGTFNTVTTTTATTTTTTAVECLVANLWRLTTRQSRHALIWAGQSVKKTSACHFSSTRSRYIYQFTPSQGDAGDHTHIITLPRRHTCHEDKPHGRLLSPHQSVTPNTDVWIEQSFKRTFAMFEVV